MRFYLLFLILVALLPILAGCGEAEFPPGVYPPDKQEKGFPYCTEAGDCGEPIKCDDGTTRPGWSCYGGTCGAINYVRNPCLS